MPWWGWALLGWAGLSVASGAALAAWFRFLRDPPPPRLWIVGPPGP